MSLRKPRWMQFEEVMKKYPDGTYEICDVGIQTVRTEDIIGLGLKPKDIANDNKMKRLRESIAKLGWKDVLPMDLNLYLTPEGKYTVCTGGNHRPFLADELKIPTIEAQIDVIIPKEKISVVSLRKIDELRKQYRDLENEVTKLNEFLKITGIQRLYKYKKEDEQCCRMFDELTQIQNRITNVLKNEANLLRYIPTNW